MVTTSTNGLALDGGLDGPETVGLLYIINTKELSRFITTNTTVTNLKKS
jgi:hypothetical protein